MRKRIDDSKKREQELKYKRTVARNWIISIVALGAAIFCYYFLK